MKSREGRSTLSIADATHSRQAKPGQAVPATTPSVDHLLGAPLPRLLTEHNAQIVEITSVDDYRFFGQLFQKRNGDVLLAMPAGRDDLERDCTVRMLLAHLNGLPTDRFPDALTATTITDVVKNGVDVL